MSAPLPLAIVIVSWNTLEMTLACLRSLRVTGYLERAAVWVVDNHSEDGSADAIAAHVPEVHLIRNPLNVGFATANNIALRRVNAPLLLLLNPDTEVGPGSLDVLCEHMDSHPACGMAGPRLLNPDGSLQLSAFRSVQPWDLYYECARFPRGWQPRGQRHPRRLHALAPDVPGEVEYVTGAALLVRRAVIERIGYLDEAFFMYAEEVDWCFRARQAGWRVDYVPMASIIHWGGQAARLVATRMLAQRYASTLQFIAKHQGPVASVKARGLLTLANLQNAVFACLRLLGGKQTREECQQACGVAFLLIGLSLLGWMPEEGPVT